MHDKIGHMFRLTKPSSGRY